MEYFVIESLVEDVWISLKNGHHLLIPGPRRIGKTELMKHILENPESGYLPIYLIIEATDSVNDLYRKILYHLINEEITGKHQAIWKKALLSFKGINIEELGQKVKFGQTKDIDFELEFRHFLKNLELDKTIILMLDEFPQTLENIMESDSDSEARRLLKLQREIRQAPEFRNKIQFIYAGSIGLENLVERLGSSKHINDIQSIVIPSLTRPQATQFLRRLADKHELDISQEMADYLFKKLQWLIPFYIQITVEGIQNQSPDKKDIDQAFDFVLTQRQYFAHWHTRLKQSLPREQYLFARQLLNQASNPDLIGIASADITNLAVKNEVEEHQTEVLNILKHDGYMNNQDNPKHYYFNSPLVRIWWWNNVAN